MYKLCDTPPLLQHQFAVSNIFVLQGFIVFQGSIFFPGVWSICIVWGKIKEKEKEKNNYKIL